MNLLLLAATDIVAPGLASVALSRYPARAGWWPPQPGRQLLLGLRDGLIGEGVVEHVGEQRARIRFTLDRAPPPALPLTLLLALPRPKMLRRVLRTAAEIGIKRIWLINSSRVEKSYWQSPLLAPAMLEGYLAAGLEQACDTVLPRVELRKHYWWDVAAGAALGIYSARRITGRSGQGVRFSLAGLDFEAGLGIAWYPQGEVGVRLAW